MLWYSTDVKHKEHPTFANTNAKTLRLKEGIKCRVNSHTDDNLNAIDRTIYRHSNFGALEPCLLFEKNNNNAAIISQLIDSKLHGYVIF